MGTQEGVRIRDGKEPIHVRAIGGSLYESRGKFRLDSCACCMLKFRYDFTRLVSIKYD